MNLNKIIVEKYHTCFINMIMPNEHDMRYKKLFSNVKLVKELFESFVNVPFVKELDFDNAEKIDKSFVSENFTEKESDIIYRVKHKDRDVYIFLLIEFQSTVDKFMAVRMLRYILELYSYIIEEKKPDKLPAVFPLMLYNGDKKWTAPLHIEELIDINIPLEYVPSFRYFKIAENEFDKEYLKKIQNSISALFFVENLNRNEIFENIGTIFRIMEKEEPELIKQITLFIRNYFKTDENISSAMTERIIDEKEAKQMLAQTIEAWKTELITESFDKGKNDGKDEKAIETAKKMIEEGFEIKMISKITDLPVDKIESLFH